MPLKIDSVRLDQLAADPTSPIDGEIWYNATEDAAKRREDGATRLFFPPLDTAKSDGVSSTTLGTFQEKLNLNVTGLAAGTYLLHYAFVVAGSAASTEVEARVQRDNTTDSLLVNWTPGTGSKNVGAGIDFFTLSAGTHDFDIDFRRASGSGTASIEQARLALQRIA